MEASVGSRTTTSPIITLRSSAISYLVGYGRRSTSSKACCATSPTPSRRGCTLAAVDDFYIRHGLGSGKAARVEIPATAPRALGSRAQLRYLRAVQVSPSPRDQALALVPFYAGARIAEIVARDVDDRVPLRTQGD